MNKRLAFLAFVITSATAFCCPPLWAQSSPSWPPVPAEELALKDDAYNPGSPAMILEYDVQTDNTKSTETVYKRIKIFRAEGKKFADVEIPYFEKSQHVEEIQAKVTPSSGKAENFNGAIYDKEIVKLRNLRYNVKAFTLPNIEIGAVIEYSYRTHWRSDIPDVFRNPSHYITRDAMAYPAASWEIQQEIPLRHGRFSLTPVRGAATRTYSHDLYAMNGECSRLRPARPQNDGHVAKRDDGVNE